MIIRKHALETNRRSTSATPAGSRARKREIHMWEQVQRLGRTFYVPLDQDLQPLGDLALEDSTDEAYALSQTFKIAPHFEPPADWDESVEGLVVQYVERFLSDADATTYQVYEAILLRLQASGLLEQGAAVDLLRILAHNFYHYEVENDRGAMLRKWSVKTPPASQSDALQTMANEWDSYIMEHLN